MKDDYKNKLASKIAARYQDLEERIMQDIVRRIVKAGEITSTADWQINRLRILGYSSEDIEKEIKKVLNASYPEMFELYDKVINWEYVRNKGIYEQINAEYIPFEENGQLKQITEAIIDQSFDDLENVTNSLGFYLDYGNGQKVLTPLSQVYTKYLDAACYDIVTGAFDYNSVLRRVVTQLTNSGLRQIDYSSGRANRVDVAARRAAMTAVSQITGKISEYNAQKLGTEYFEVEWHAGARPTHSVWQGRIWSKEQLYSVCGLGTVTGLLGANCYHTYYPFFPGISQRNWTDEWLDAKNEEEAEPKTFDGKEYTLYEAKQRQRQMETAMRAQREKVKLLQAGGADQDEVILHKAKYQGQLNEYSRFCRKMSLTEERERIYYDMRGMVATNNKTQNAMFHPEMIKNATKDIAQYKRYKEVLGDSVGSLAKFGRVKYNDSEQWKKLQNRFSTYLEIDKKDWTEEFKNASKQAYDRFTKENITMSVHALSRLPRLNKPGLPEVSEEMLIKIIRGEPNYAEGEDRQIYFIQELQLLIVRNKGTGDIVSVVRRNNPKEVWKNV
ncbi:phage minor capsid protein [Dorea formicigenerans]|uniref:Minor capsid protein n=1 Tax=Dorea formicigenerans TaxID=39486 RepID=A0A412MDU6_9FIRM|nr:phage minor capsid protein [Dorea formicigenerans]RGT09558.1 minor capsid protein [Dorea formicigenerans]RHE28190.1 minor capsid protein [Dorea formicigenerans]